MTGYVLSRAVSGPEYVGLQRVHRHPLYVAAKLAALTAGSGRAAVINDGSSLA